MSFLLKYVPAVECVWLGKLGAGHSVWARAGHRPLAAIRFGFAAVVTLTGLIVLSVSVDAQGVRKPKPLPGVDPGGVMVAVIGPGIDYTRPGIADRLARDGEGEIIGFDLVDRDRRPFCSVECVPQTEAVMALLEGAPLSRLSVFKVDGATLAAPALQMAVQAKAAIVLLDLPDDAQTSALLRAASERFRDTLIVLASRPRQKQSAASFESKAAPATAETGGMAPAEAAAPPTQASGQPGPEPAPRPQVPQAAPTAATGGAAAIEGTPRPDTVIAVPTIAAGTTSGGLAVAVRIVAAAARIVAERPSTRGAALKAEVASLQ